MLGFVARELRPPVSWRWAMSVVFAALVVAGLLGMHTLSVGHPAPAPVSVIEHGAEHEQDAMAEPSGVPDAGCADCGGAAHEAMTLACVLGLLVTVILVARTGPGVVRRLGRPCILALAIRPPIPVPLRPPSLLELSISRT